VEFVREFSATGAVLVLAPTRAPADEVALEACGAGLAGIARLAFREFILELSAAEMNRRELVPVGRLVREALAARVAAEACSRNALGYLRPAAQFPGFPRALTDTLEELRLHAVAPSHLRTSGESGADLACLLEAYNHELSERRFADHATRVALAIEAVSGGLKTLQQTALVVFDLSPRTRLECNLLKLAIDAARAVIELRLSSGDGVPSTSLESVQRYLFSKDAVPPGEDDGRILIRSTSGESLESVEIARDIHAAAAEGVPFDQIAILLRSPERHRPLVTEALRRAGIPSHCTLATERPDVSGRALVALLHCASEGLSASRFSEYLSLGQVPEESRSAPALWERLLVDAAVIGGLNRWQKRLAGLREQFQRHYTAEEDEEARGAIVQRIEALDNLTSLALPVIGRLDELPKNALWGEWIARLTDLAGFVLADPEHVIEFLEQLEPMAEIGPVSLNEVLLVLSARLNSLPAISRESRFGKVWISSVEEARGMAFLRVFLPGVNEGLFPRPMAEDPLLLESQRRQLGIELRADDTELLRIAAASACERLTISFSRLDLLTGRERVPSFYAFEAHRAAGLREMGVREFEARTRSKVETRIGWPAPKQPAEAIDDSEFDLATLAPLEKGAGQYLKNLPGRSVESLRARWTRWHKPWKAADGLIVEEIGNRELQAYSLSQRAWSPSALQQYARCPYRFALRGIYGLRPAERPSGIQRLDAATRGEIYHAVQYELLRGLAEKESLPIRPETLEFALAYLDTVLQEVARRAAEELAPAIPQIWRAEIDAVRANLRGWVQQKAALDPDWTPQFYELSFGLKDPTGRDPRSQKESVEIDGGFRLRGSIDLVERHSSGVLRVVDHKTGRIPDPRPELTGGGEVLQPALYALAAEKILGEPVAFGRLHYCTIAQNYSTIDVPIGDWSRRRTEQALRIIDDAIRNGFLPAAPRKDGCKRCEYLPVCGPYEEERAGEKSGPELKSLKELRAWR